MNITQMIEAGSANPLVLFVFALVLGALHGLEPGHSKTMMAAYIIAVQGTVKQAVLLGVSAAFSHSIVVWVLAFLALTWGNEMIGEQLEPWFVIVSGVLVLAIAVWMLRNGVQQARQGHGHGQEHGHRPHPHGHDHDHPSHGHPHTTPALALASPQAAARMESTGLDDPALDAHARAHAAEIRARLASGRIGTWQTVLFGLTGGLIPCPAAITVFVLCLHLEKLTLGITLVAAFSTGLALTLVAIGTVAALGLGMVTTRTSRFEQIMQYAPWISAALIALIGALIIWSGVAHLQDLSHSH
ncbi:MAG: nickel/cobalt efflux transporter [Pseudomonadota bacterium]